MKGVKILFFFVLFGCHWGKSTAQLSYTSSFGAFSAISLTGSNLRPEEGAMFSSALLGSGNPTALVAANSRFFVFMKEYKELGASARFAWGNHLCSAQYGSMGTSFFKRQELNLFYGLRLSPDLAAGIVLIPHWMNAGTGYQSQFALNFGCNISGRVYEKWNLNLFWWKNASRKAEKMLVDCAAISIRFRASTYVEMFMESLFQPGISTLTQFGTRIKMQKSFGLLASIQWPTYTYALGYFWEKGKCTWAHTTSWIRVLGVQQNFSFLYRWISVKDKSIPASSPDS